MEISTLFLYLDLNFRFLSVTSSSDLKLICYLKYYMKSISMAIVYFNILHLIMEVSRDLFYSHFRFSTEFWRHCLLSSGKKWIFNFLEWESNSQPVTFTIARLCLGEMYGWVNYLYLYIVRHLFKFYMTVSYDLH